MEGSTFVCHNELRDVTAKWLGDVCHVVVTEPPLQTQERVLYQPLLTNKTMLVQICILVGSGVASKVPFLMYIIYPSTQSYCNFSHIGKEATVFYHQLTDLLTNKHGWMYSSTLSWVHSVLAFSLLRSAIMCI